MNTRPTILFAVLAAAAGLLAATCGTARSLAAESRADDTAGYFVRAGAPHPLACAADDDCVAGPGVNPENGCCDTGVEVGVYGRDYVAWRAAWMRENCGDVECPILPPPAPPERCALEGRCVEGRCRNACS